MLRLPTHFSLSLLLLAAACGGEDPPTSPGGGTGNPDGSVGPTIDAGAEVPSDADVEAPDADLTDAGAAVDLEGPEITLILPVPGELVSGIINMTVSVTDASGVDETSVIATVAGTIEVALTSNGGAEYVGLFDTRALGPMVFPNIIVRAQDQVGNQSSLGYLVGLDNVPPVITLDSPSLREAKVESGDLLCSNQFDPLGDDAVNDGEAVPQLFEIRARLEDLPNTGVSTSTVVIPRAHVDANNVDLFILDDETAALIVDTDGDGFCDDINPLLVPTSTPSSSNDVAAIQLAEISASGASFFGADSDPTFATTGNDLCTAGTDADAPEQLCASTSLTRVIQTEVEAVPVIYGVPPAEGLQCMGNAVDTLATNLNDGWVCAAVRASDALGNLSVSSPLRLCIDSFIDGGEGCPAVETVNLTGAPNCTGTYNVVTDTVDTNVPCTLERVFQDDALVRIDL